MRISKSDWENYINALSRLSDKAAKKMWDYVDRHGFDDREAIIDYAYALITKYGEGSAALAAEMYDAIAEASNAGVESATVAATPEYGEVAKVVNGTIKQSPNYNTISAAVGRLVKRTGADTILNNALRDGAEFAWVPHGDTCAFCIALASRGWQRMSKRALKNGHAEHIHANCNCEYSIRFDGETTVAGYDPEEYAAMYYGAEGNTPRERLNSLRRANDAPRRSLINAQKREEYRIRREAEGHEVHPYGARVQAKTGEMPFSEYTLAKDLWRRVTELDLPTKEKEYVYEQFDEWLTPEEKQSAVVCRPIGNYYYKGVNLGHNQYKIYAKEPIEPTKDWLDEILTEVIGPDWRKYDE